MKKLLSAILSIVLCLSITIPAWAITSTPKGNTKTKVTLSVAVWGIQDGFSAANAKNDKIFNDLCKKYNVTIKPVQITWNDWQDKVKLWGASNQLPDMFAGLLDPALYATFAKQGLIKALPANMNSYPVINKTMRLSSLSNLKVNGKFYTVPRMSGSLDEHQACLSRTMAYRKDWAKEAGYTTEPQNFDQYVAMCKAVLKKHPDAVGLSINTKNYLSAAFLWSFPEASLDSSWVKENGSWIPSYASTKMYTGIKQLRTLYKDGILDKDFVIQKDADGVVKFQNGKSFSCFVGSSIDAAKYTAANPNVTIANSIGFMMPFPAADGKRYCFNGTPYWSNTYFSNKLSATKFDRALQLLNYMCSDEYTVLKVNGIEGTDWKMSNGKAVSLLGKNVTLKDKYPITDAFCWLGTWATVPATSSKHVFSSDTSIAQYDKLFNADTYNQYVKSTTPAKVNFDVTLMSTPLKDKSDTLRVQAVDEMIKAVIGNDDPIVMWKNSVKSLKEKGLDKAIAETNTYAKKAGIK